jgi:hypothetical protein
MFPYDTTTQANLKVFLFLFTTIPSSSSQPIFYLSIHPSQRNSYSHSPSSRTSSSSSSSSSLHNDNHFMKWKLESTAFFFGPSQFMVAKFQICYSLFLQGHHLFHATNHHLFKRKKMPIRRTQERGFSTKEKRFGVREKAVSLFRPQTASLVQGGMKLSATNSASDRRLYAASGDDLRFWWKAVSGVGPGTQFGP